MKNKNVLIATFLAMTFFGSCSKTLILFDGAKEKKIKVASSIIFTKDENNHPILSFQSVEGTKYSFDASAYTYRIK
jgi:hypothetical protein